MMQSLRKYMKQIFWVVAICFIATIVFSWGMGGFKNKGSHLEQGIVGIIDGRKIQYQEYSQAVAQRLEMLKQETGNIDIPEYRIRSIRDETWEGMIQNILYAKEVQRLKIQASPEEVVFQLRNSPPDFIMSNEQFQTDGEFDVTKYQQALSDPRNYEAWIPVENYLQSAIPLQKLTTYIMNTVRVSEGEVREAYRQRNQKINAKYIFFDANKVSLEEIEITDSEIDNYYREHQDEYQVPEQRKIQYVLFEGKPSAEDSVQVLKDIQDILQRVQAGADFAELAKESDDEGSRDKGGDLGFFGKGDMVKPFEEAAFSAKIGDVVGPVETQHGLHIIQILARKIEDGETKVHARHILLKYKTSPETYDDLNDRAKYFYDEASNSQGKYFTEIAEQEGLTLKESPLFQKGGFVPGIGMASRINLFAFQEKLHWVSPPMSSGDNIIVFRIFEIQKLHTRPLEEVESTIRNSIQREKQKNKAGDNCGQVWQKIDGGMEFEQAASVDSLEIRETGLIQLQSYVSGIGRDAGFSGTAFKLAVGDVSGPVEGNRGYYLIKVIDRTEVNEETMNSDEIESIKQELYRSKQQQMFAAWYNDLKEKTQIEDYRDQFF